MFLTLNPFGAASTLALSATHKTTSVDAPQAAIIRWLEQAQAIGDVEVTSHNLEILEAALDHAGLQQWVQRTESARSLLEEAEDTEASLLSLAHGVFASVADDERAVRKLAMAHDSLKLLQIAGSIPPPSQRSFAETAHRLRVLTNGGRGTIDRSFNDTTRQVLFLLFGLNDDLKSIVQGECSSAGNTYSAAQDLRQTEEAAYRIWHTLMGALLVVDNTDIPALAGDELRKAATAARAVLNATREEQEAMADLQAATEKTRQDATLLDFVMDPIQPLQVMAMDDDLDVDVGPGSRLAQQLTTALELMIYEWKSDAENR